MKAILFLSLRYLRFHKVKTAIMVFSVAVALFLPLAVHWLVHEYQRDLLSRARTTPLVAGAPGSRLDLILHALYYRGKPARDLTMGEVEKINRSELALAIPLLSKHTARGFPIVGTSLEYFHFRGLTLSQGMGLTHVGDCVVGDTVARKLGLKPGDRLVSDPENAFDLAGSYPVNMLVKGILPPTGTPDDGAILTDYKTEWAILGIMHGHEDVTQANLNLLLSRSSTNTVASSGILPYQEITTDNLDLFHVHGDPSTFPVTAILIDPNNDKSGVILRGRYEDPRVAVQLLVPTQIINETLDMVFRIKRFYDAQASLVIMATSMLLALVILLSSRLRQGEMETMARIGCVRWMTFGLQLSEITIVVVVGSALAVGASWVLASKLSLSSSTAAPNHAGSRLLSQSAEPAAKPKFAVTNYPMWYFTRRLAGGRVDIVFPVPREEDPAFWKPSDADILKYQTADLILLNGAEYEKWGLTAVLPLARQVITSAAFADRYVANGEVVTHSHGPQGMHSHGLLDFNTWMDPTQAALQAYCIRDQLTKVLPSAEKEFNANFQKLQEDLTALDASLAAASTALGSSPLLASHPVYQYAARRYNWNLKCVHWEPDEMPSEGEWKEFEKLHASHPAKFMIWEEAPLHAVAERLRKMGVEPIAFETCASEPDSHDYFKAMRANAERLANALRRN